MTGYIITGYCYVSKKVYTSKAKAEMVCEHVQECMALSGSYNTVGVEEIEIDTEEA